MANEEENHIKSMEEEATTLSHKNLKKLDSGKLYLKVDRENKRSNSSKGNSGSGGGTNTSKGGIGSDSGCGVSDSGIEIKSNYSGSLNSGSNLTLKSGSSAYKTENSMKTTSSNQSVMSFLTIHSKMGSQSYNDHWIERAAERGNLNFEDETTKM